MTDRVRALLITPAGELLTIRRIRPGKDPYWVLPGGGIDAGEDLETALALELHEEPPLRTSTACCTSLSAAASGCDSALPGDHQRR
jgi:ADP-ribose pyrophosphatase YjhB (NUDIX family)